MRLFASRSHRDLRRRLRGAIFAALALAVPLSASASSISILNNGDFETPFATGSGVPVASLYGKWAVGDPASSVLAANGITPFAGSRMFVFGVAPAGNTSVDVYQVVDVNAYAAAIDAGLVTADLSAFFNATSAAPVGMSLFRYSGPPTAFGGNGFTKLVGINNAFSLDGSKATWEEFGFQDVVVPTGTRYLMFGLNQSNSVSAPTYADNASLVLNINDGTSVVPEPGTLSLLLGGLGMAGLRRVRQGRRRPH